MTPTISHVLHIMFIGAAISFPVCLFLAALAMRGLDMLDGEGE